MSIHSGPVTLGAVTFGEVDSFGVEWILSRFDGWTDGLASTGQATQRSAADGAWVGQAYYGPRTLTLEGTGIASTWDAAEAAKGRLLESVPLNVLAPLTVATGTPRQAFVRQAEQPLVSILGGALTFSLSLIAPDPLLYSTAVETVSTRLPQTIGGVSLPISLPISIGATVTAGTLTVTNVGNADTWPTFRIDGPCPAGATITLAATGATLTVPSEIPAGRFLLIETNPSRRGAWMDGTAARVVVGTWFTFPGVSDDNPTGTSTVAFGAPSYDAGALLTSTYRAAYK